MIYLLAIFLPPVALLVYGKIFQAILNLLVWLLAIISLPFAILPVITTGLSLIIWGIAVLHAILAVNSAKQDARAKQEAGKAPDYLAYRHWLACAYTDFVGSSAQAEKVFAVFRKAEGSSFVPLSSLTD